MPEQSLADLQRLVDRSRRDSRHNYGAHPTGAGGSLHTPHPKQGAGRKQIGPGEFGLSRPPIGEITRLHVHGHLGNSGEPVLFESIAYQNGFEQATAPNPQLQLPYNAIYGIEGELEWVDGYTGGGEVWLYLDAEPYMQLPGFTEAWTRWPIAMEFDAQKGARLSLVVVHDDSADHDMEGEVVVATKERLVQLVQVPTGFWTVDGFGAPDEELVLLSSGDGSISQSETWPEPQPTQGMVLVDGDLWAVGHVDADDNDDNALHHWTPGEGTATRVAGLGFAPDGLAHDGTDFWTFDDDYSGSPNFTARVMKVDSSGTTLTTGADTSFFQGLACEWHGGALWGIVSGGSGFRLVRFDGSGNVVQTETLPLNPTGDTGLASTAAGLTYLGLVDGTDEQLVTVDTSGVEQSRVEISTSTPRFIKLASS